MIDPAVTKKLNEVSSKKKIVLRNINKGFYANIHKIPANLATQKTVAVVVKKRIYVSKVKRFYFKNFKYQVHCDLSNPLFNRNNTTELKVGQKVYCTYTRRLSALKSSVIIFRNE